MFLNNRLFYGLGAITILFVLGFFTPVLFNISKVLLFILVILTIVDIFIVYSVKNGFSLTRDLPERLSNGDENKIIISLKNNYNVATHSTLIEELPYQFQKRDFIFKQQLKPKTEKTIFYDVRPTKRGVYNFGHVNV